MNYRNHLSPPQFPATWASAWGEDRHGLWMKLTYQGASLTFRWMILGTFMMGSPDGYADRYGNEDYHEVTLAQGFWLADTPITQAFWQAINGDNPSHFKGDDSLPVEQISWDDVQAFIQKLNQLHPDLTVRLPWEAEWEYACRAGTDTAFHFGDETDLSKANYRGVWKVKDPESYKSWDKEWSKDALKKTTPVKSYSPNSWGLYDMHGNVWEWCQDAWQEHLGTDSPSEVDSGRRAVRGGSWRAEGRDCRSAVHFRHTPVDRDFYVGCRLALGHSSPSAEQAGSTHDNPRRGSSG